MFNDYFSSAKMATITGTDVLRKPVPRENLVHPGQTWTLTQTL